MLSTVLLLVWCTFSVDADGGIYRVDRQDFSSPSPVARSLNYQNLVNGQPGVYKVNRQDFAGNAPFSQNTAIPSADMHGYYYPQQKQLHPFERVGNGYLPPYMQAPTSPPPLRLFVPAESGYQDGAANGQSNYKDVLSLSEYNRRFPSVPSYSQPSVPAYLQPSVPSYSQPSGPSYSQPSAPSYSQPSAPSYSQPSAPSYSQPSAPSYSQPSVPLYSQPSVPSYSQPSVPVYYEYPAQSQTSSPLYFQRPVQSQTSIPFYVRRPPTAPSYSPPPPQTYSPSPVTTYWMDTSTDSTIRFPPTTTPPPAVVPSTTLTYSPLPQAPAVNEDDGILSPIPVNDEENKPLPPVSAQESLRKVYVTEDAAGNRHTKIKYHSFDDFVEISDDHRELLESFGSIQNNESDFSEVPEASPIRRRRNATHSQVFSMFSVRDSQLKGTLAARRDPEQLISSYVNRLWQQIKILNDMKKAVQKAKLEQQYAKSSPRTIVAADDSTVIVFNGNANFDSKLGDPAQESAENLPQPSVPLAESTSMDVSNLSEDLRLSSEDANLHVKQSTEREMGDASTVNINSSDGSHEVLLQRDEGADAHPSSDPREQIIYLTEEPLKVATHSSTEDWDDMK